MYQLKYIIPLLCVASISGAAEWSQFRGPNGSGVSSEKNLPVKWDATTNVRWKAVTTGRSVSSPVVYGNKVFLTSSSGSQNDRLHVYCFDLKTGKQLWHRQMTATGNTGCHPKSSMAAPSPCADERAVYCLFATADLATFDHDGNLLWYRSLTSDYPKISNQVGMASSPVVHNNTLVVPMDTVGESFVAALDTQYGKNIWKVSRPRMTNWVTPTIIQKKDGAEVLFTSSKEVVSYELNTGKVAWSIEQGASTISTTIINDNKAYVPISRNLVCLDLVKDQPTEVWKTSKLTSSSATPVILGDRIYAIGGAGTLSCGNLKTGKDLWTERIGRGKGQFWASPIAGDGKIYTFDDAGICTVIQPNDEGAEILSVNDMKAEIMGTPAIADGCLIIRTIDGLYCIGKK
ncbi:MAG: PQQ-binding-like beta-propeller repeat protein [Zavarzinella sp.]